MKFRTEINIPRSDWKITYQAQLLSMGSCFAERVGKRFESVRFLISVNPLGIMYNPVSICQSLQIAMQDRPLPEAIYAEGQQLWHAFELHSQFNHSDQDRFSEAMKKAFADTRNALTSASVVILTFGTAFVYRRKQTGQIVANCHKYPAKEFSRELLSLNHIKSEMVSLLETLRASNPGLRLILTVSPVRHVRDTLSLNSASKATLRLVCHQLEQEFEQVTYFPAFEIMVDDLRDYRYYKDDLLHPTEFAETYIWQKFTETYLAEEAKTTLKTWEQIQRDLAHKPFHPQSANHQAFLRRLLDRLQNISTDIDCQREIAQVKRQLNL